MSHPVPKESPRHKSNAPLTRPVQEETPANKINVSLRRRIEEKVPADKSNAPLALPVQEENPANKINVSLRRPIEEKDPADKSNAPLVHLVQEENPAGKLNESFCRPVQEEYPTDKSNAPLAHPGQEQNPVDKSNASFSCPMEKQILTDKANTSLSRLVEEESPVDKSDVPLPFLVQEEFPRDNENTSLSGPVQEECRTAKSTTSLSHSVPDEKPTPKPDLLVTSSRREELCTCLYSMSIQTKTEGDLTPARDHRLTGEAEPSRSSTVDKASEGIRPGSVENTATRTVGLDRNENAEEMMMPSDAVGTSGDSRTVTNFESFDETGTFRAIPSGSTSFKPDAALGQTWQENIGGRRPKKTSCCRVLKEISYSSSNEMLGLDELCTVTQPESQRWSVEVESQGGKHHFDDAVTKTLFSDVVTKWNNARTGAKSDGGLHRGRLKPGPEPKSAVASSNVGACNIASLDGTECGLNSSSRCACFSSFSKEFPVGSSLLAQCQIKRPVNQSKNKHSPDLRNNLSCETQSSANGDSTLLEEANPNNDHECELKCESGCFLM